MAGKFFKNKLLICLLLLFFSCWNLIASEEKWVAVLISDSENAYEMPVQSFSDAIGIDVRTFNLEGDIRNDGGLKKMLTEDSPALIFALGAKAAYAAKLWTKKHQDIPVIFSMVINWQKYNLLDDQKNIIGISSEVNPGNQFLSLQMFAQNAKNIGVIYSPDHSTEIIENGRQAAKRLGFTLIEHQALNPQDFKVKYRQLASSVDALWILQDPVTYTLENMSWLEKRCIRDRIICIGQSRNLAQLGVMLSVWPDVTNIGVQAASMARNILNRGQKPSSIGVMEPLGTKIFLNKKTAEKIGVTLSPQAVDMVSEMIE